MKKILSFYSLFCLVDFIPVKFELKIGKSRKEHTTGEYICESIGNTLRTTWYNHEITCCNNIGHNPKHIV
jgi:hypothetical protein